MDEHALRELDAAMIRLADGDRSACAPLFSLLRPSLVAFATRALGTDRDADDAAQEALEKIFSQAADYDPSRAAFAWALALTSWECRTILQRRLRQREEPLDNLEVEIASATPQADEVMQRATMLESLRFTLTSLSESDQRTLEAAFIREADGPREPAFRKRKERALSRLRAAWSKIYGA